VALICSGGRQSAVEGAEALAASKAGAGSACQRMLAAAAAVGAASGASGGGGGDSSGDGAGAGAPRAVLYTTAHEAPSTMLTDQRGTRNALRCATAPSAPAVPLHVYHNAASAAASVLDMNSSAPRE